jgi:hypothetical protein
LTTAIRCIVAFAIAWSLQIGVSFAEDDYLDRASGPGPFKGMYLHYRFLCVSRDDTQPNPDFVLLTPWERTASALNLPVALIHKYTPGSNYNGEAALNATDARGHCRADDKNVRGYFELTYRRAASQENDLVGPQSQVHIASYEIAYIDRFTRPLAFSIGTGLNWFDARATPWFRPWDSEDDKSLEFKSFRRISITPSLIFSPLATAGNGPRAHLIRVQAGATIFVRGFHAQDFCNGTARCLDPTWETHGADVIPMVRAIIDGSLLMNGW